MAVPLVGKTPASVSPLVVPTASRVSAPLPSSASEEEVSSGDEFTASVSTLRTACNFV